MKILIPAFIMMLFSLYAKAHQPDISTTLLVEQGAGQWVLQMRAALTAFEYEIENHFGKKSYNTPEEFEDLVITHIKENFSAIVNENNFVEIQNGMVKLGHETSATFEIIGMPKNIQQLEIKNSTFRNIYHNRSALFVLKEGFQKEQFKLDNDNDHTAKLQVKDNVFELIKPLESKSLKIQLYIGVSLLLIALVAIFLIRRKQTNPQFILNKN